MTSAGGRERSRYPATFLDSDHIGFNIDLHPHLQQQRVEGSWHRGLLHLTGDEAYCPLDWKMSTLVSKHFLNDKSFAPMSK